jgi:hypothetical protein
VTICILSGSTDHRLRSDVNHRVYARQHAYDYLFDKGPYTRLTNAYFFKLWAIARVLPFFDWVFWLDDDAWFTDFDRPLEPFVEGLDRGIFLVACKSPVNPSGDFTFLNSGVLFLRNCPQSRDFLETTRNVSLDLVKAWWDAKTLGLFTSGDQDAMTYVIQQQRLLAQIVLLPCDAFNSRPYHYRSAANEHFVVHFPGVRDKATAVRRFAIKCSLDETTLLPRPLLEQFDAERAQPDQERRAATTRGTTR